MADSTSKQTTPTFYGKPFFRGGEERGALIRFTTDPDKEGPQSASTVWFVDPKTKQLIPILSEQAFNDFFTETLEQAAANGRIIDLPLNVIGVGGMLEGYIPLEDSQGIQPGGTRAAQETPLDINAILNRYGQPLNDAKQKDAATFLLGAKMDGNGGFLSWVKANSDDISDEVVNGVIKDKITLALYIGASAYGGYYPPAIYSDLKRRQLLKDGNAKMATTKVIDENKPASEYYRTPGGMLAKNYPDLLPPDYLGDIDMNLLNSSIFKLPDEVFQTLVPPFDWSSEEGKAELDSIKTALYDVIQRQVEAKNDQELQAAQYDWDQFKTEINRKYGITLSNNADEAWNQIDNLATTYSSRGLLNTGFHNLALDKYLQDRRQADTRLREEKLTSEEEAKRQYYLRYATPEQMSQLSDEEKEKWGLKPSQETLNWFKPENLKALYPDLSDEEIKRYSESLFDESGNYRSALTQKLHETKFGGYGVPEGGIEKARQGYKQDIAQAKADLAEEEAYKEFTEPEPFSKDYRADLDQPDVSDVADSTATVSKQPNASNPWYGIPASESARMTSKGDAESYWRGEWKAPVPAQTQQPSPQPSTSAQQSFAEWTKGKNDALGYNWQGYKPITGAEYATPEQRARWKNVQKVGGSLYGYYK